MAFEESFQLLWNLSISVVYVNMKTKPTTYISLGVIDFYVSSQEEDRIRNSENADMFMSLSL